MSDALKRFTPELLSRAAELRAAKWSVYRIAAELGFSYAGTFRAMQRAGLLSGRQPGVPSRKAPPQLTRRDVLTRLHSGQTQPQIAAALGVTRDQVKGFISRNDLTRFDSRRIPAGELAAELGLHPDTLVKGAQAGHFKGARYSHMLAFEPAEAERIRAHYAARPHAEEYAHWLTTCEAAALLGLTRGGFHQVARAGDAPLTPVHVRASRGKPCRWNPEEVHALAARRRAQRRAD